MADDIDELLDEVESKYINSEDGNQPTKVAVQKTTSRISAEAASGGAEELDAAIHSICNIPEPIDSTSISPGHVVHLNKAAKRRCTVVYVGDAATSDGLSSGVSQRRNTTYRRPRPNSATKIYTKRFFAKPVFELSVKDLEAESARRKQKEVIERLFERKLAVVTDKMILDVRKFKRIKSSVWSHFGDVRLLMSEAEVKKLNIDHHVIHLNDEEVLLCKSFVACVRCSAVFSYESHSYGTSTLRSHLKSCGKPRFNRKDNKNCVRVFRQRRSVEVPLNGGVSDQLDSSKPVYQEQVIKFREESIKLQKQITMYFLSKQRPFETICNPEFQKMLQTCVKIGSTAGNVNLGNLLCSQSELEQDLMYKMYNNGVVCFESDMENVFGVSFSLEIWVDVIEESPYLSMVCYYSDSKGTFRYVVLQTFEFPYENRTGHDMNHIVMDCLKQMNLIVYKRLFVIDSSTNICEAFEEEQFVHCICNSVDCAMQSVIKTLNTSREENDDELFILPSFTVLINQCKLLVLHFKQKKIQHNLPNNLHLCSDSSWKSILKMAESINNQWDHIIDILGERGELKLFNIDEELLCIVVDFLEIFRDGVEELASVTYPTLNIVIPWWFKWKTHCLHKEDESPFLAALKSYTSTAIENYVTKNISLYHKLATMLDPRFKGLQHLSEEDQVIARNEAEKLVKECEESLYQNKSCEATYSIVPGAEGFTEFYSTPQSQEGATQLCFNSSYEVEHYLAEQFALCTEDLDSENRFNPLKYWVRVKDTYPYLSKVASWILSCPAGALRNNEELTGNWMVSWREVELPRKCIQYSLFSKSLKNV